MRPDTVLRRGLRILGVAIREEPRIFAVAVGGSALYAVMTVASAWVLGEVTDRVVLPAFRSGEVGVGALVAAGSAVLAVGLLKAAGVVGRRLAAGLMQYRLQATYRRRVTRQYVRLPLAWHQRHPTGQLLSNANADVEAIWYPIAPLPMAVGVLFMLVVAAGSMLLTDVPLAVVGFLVFPAIFLLNVVYQRRLSPLATRAQQLRAEVSGVAHESFEGALVVKTLGREAVETERFAAAAHRQRDAQIRVGRVRGLFDPALEALPSLGVLAVLIVGSARVDSGALAPGELVQVAYLFTILAFPVRAIGWVLGELPRSVVGWDRVARVLEASGSLEHGGARLPEAARPASLSVRNVRFGYVDGADVLRGVSFDVAAGRTLALVGATAAGKSTLAALLVRLVDPAAGKIHLDGVDVRDLAPGALAAVAALVPQQAFLFDDTVRGNVTLGAPLDDERVWEALALAQAHRFVAALPQGLDTPVGERGTRLSGGQRQRIALARALVRRPRLLVLDDATSSVDPRVEARILAGLRDSPHPTTVVVVAYRRATIALADEVAFLEGGQIRALGPHAELIEAVAGYRALVTAYDRTDAEVGAAEADDLDVAAAAAPGAAAERRRDDVVV